MKGHSPHAAEKALTPEAPSTSRRMKRNKGFRGPTHPKGFGNWSSASLESCPGALSKVGTRILYEQRGLGKHSWEGRRGKAAELSFPEKIIKAQMFTKGF